MNVDTLKKPLLPFFPIEMSYSGRNGSKSLDCQNFDFFQTIENERRYTQKSTFAVFSNRDELYWAKRFKKLGLPEFWSCKTIGNERRYIQKAIFAVFSNRDEL